VDSGEDGRLARQAGLDDLHVCPQDQPRRQREVVRAAAGQRRRGAKNISQPCSSRMVRMGASRALCFGTSAEVPARVASSRARGRCRLVLS
jgi:hypothetical protein